MSSDSSDNSLLDVSSDDTDSDAVIVDEGEFDVPSDSDSESSVEGVPGSYYGGWGTCFRCGECFMADTVLGDLKRDPG